MRNIETDQFLFHKGINEGTKQDIFDKSGQYQSCLLSVNYNPNLEFGSLVKRYGQGTLFDNQFKSEQTDNGVTDIYLSIEQANNRPNISGFSNVNPGLISITKCSIDENFIEAIYEFQCANPTSNYNYLIFCKLSKSVLEEFNAQSSEHFIVPTKDLPMVTIVGFIPLLNTVINATYAYPVWTEPNVKCIDDHSSIRGITPYGKVSDIKRYGEAILFTVKFDKDFIGVNFTTIRDLISPVYIYLYYNLIPKDTLNLFIMNGIIDYTWAELEPYKYKWQNWIIKNTPKELLNLTFGVNWYNYDRMFSQVHHEDADIELMIIESESIPDYLNVPADTQTDPTRPWEHFKNKNIHFARTFEVTNLDKLNHELDEELCFFNGVWKQRIDGTWYQDRVRIFQTAYYYGPNVEGIDTTDLAWFNDPIREPAPGDQPSITTPTQITEIRCQNVDEPLKCILDGYVCYCEYRAEFLAILDGFANSVHFYRAVVFKFWNYIDLKTPRKWYYGEKMPIILTMTINGVELFYKHTEYEVRVTPDRPPIPHWTFREYDNEHTPYDRNWINGYDGGGKQDIHIPDEQKFCTEPRYPLENWLDTFDFGTNIEGDRYRHIPDTRKTRRLSAFIVKEGQENSFHYDIGLNQYVSKGGKTSTGGLELIMPMEDYYPPDGGYNNEYWREQELHGRFVYITLRFKQDKLQKMLMNGLTSINVYVSKPSETDYLLRSIGCDSYTKATIFPLPLSQVFDIDDPQYDQYALFHKFIINGTIGSKIEDYTHVKGEQSFSTNAWTEGAPYYLAVPQKDTKTDIDQGIAAYRAPIGTIKEDVAFAVWDYMWNGDTLNIGFSGQYWDGLRADYLCIVKGLTFILNCYDRDDVMEQSIVRYSLVQKGSISPDIFPKENFMKVGQLPFTAVLEFREQLVVFNKECSYRIGMKDIADPTTWEFLETTQGTGTLSNKMVCVTPNGFCFINGNGVWISDGGIPQSLTANVERGLAINSYIQYLVLGNTYDILLKETLGDVAIGDKGFNENLEINYDPQNNEVVVSTPTTETTTDEPPVTHTFEIRLIYNFNQNNWRVEQFDMDKADGDSFLQFTTPVRSKIANTKLISFVFRSGTNTDFFFTELKKELYQDADYTFTNSVNSEYRFKDIVGKLYTHEIGDGKSDRQLKEIIVECIPMESTSKVLENGSVKTFDGWDTYSYPSDTDVNSEALRDPVIVSQLRNKEYTGQKYAEESTGDNDLVHINFNVKKQLAISKMTMEGPQAINPFNVLQTPGGTVSNEQFGSETTHVDRESIVLLAPLKSKFRRMRLYFESKIIVKIKSIVIKSVIFNRKTQ